MPTPARQRIVSAIFEKLKTVTKANGYRTDIGQNVFRWQVNPYGELEADGRHYKDSCNLKDKACSLTATVSGSMEWNLEIEIEVRGDGEGSDTFLRSSEADIISLIGLDTTWGVTDLNARTLTRNFRTEMGLKQDERIIAGMLISFVVEFRTPYWSPFAPTT